MIESERIAAALQLAARIASLNPNVAQIGAGMLASLVSVAREIHPDIKHLGGNDSPPPGVVRDLETLFQSFGNKVWAHHAASGRFGHYESTAKALRLAAIGSRVYARRKRHGVNLWEWKYIGMVTA